MKNLLKRLEKLPLEEQWFILDRLPADLLATRQGKKLHKILINLDFIIAKISVLRSRPSPSQAPPLIGLIKDYEESIKSKLFASTKVVNNLKLIQGAIQLSVHAVDQDATQLASQLLGRLLSSKATEVQTLLEQAKIWKRATWLRPLTSSLMSPDGPLVRTLQGHTDHVMSLALTPGGQYIISGSRDTTLKVWKLETGTVLRTLTGHTDAVSAVTVTPNGKFIISGSYDRTLRIWELEFDTTNSIRAEVCVLSVRVLAGHTHEINEITVTPNGQWLISMAGRDSNNTIFKIWDLERAIELQTLTSYPVVFQKSFVPGFPYGDPPVRGWDKASLDRYNPVLAAPVTPDAQWIISRLSNDTITIWDLETGTTLSTIRDDDPYFGIDAHRVALISNEQLLISGSGRLQVSDLKTGNNRRLFTGHPHLTIPVAILPDRKRAITGAEFGCLRVWDLQTETALCTLTCHTEAISSLVVTPDGPQIVTASHDRTLKIWDFERMAGSPVSPSHAGRVKKIIILPNGQYAISGGADGKLKVWHLENGLEVCTLPGHNRDICALAITSDGRHMISATTEPNFKVWDVEHKCELRSFAGYTPPLPDHVKEIAITPDGRRAVLALSDHSVKLLDLEQEVVLHSIRLSHYTPGINSLSVTPDGQEAVIGAIDNTLMLLALERETDPHPPFPYGREGHTRDIREIVVSLDGQRAVSAADDGTIRVWSLKKFEETLPFSIQSAIASTVAITPYGQRVVSGADDGTLSVWELATKTVIAKFSGDVAITACAIASDGVTLVAGDALGQVHFLRLEGAEVLPHQKLPNIFTGQLEGAKLVQQPDARADEVTSNLLDTDRFRRKLKEMRQDGLIQNVEWYKKMEQLAWAVGEHIKREEWLWAFHMLNLLHDKAATGISSGPEARAFLMQIQTLRDECYKRRKQSKPNQKKPVTDEN